jgi:AcrR family transcriptional regulator
MLDAAVVELAEVGLARFSMEGVAKRAGTGKASLYRRWPGKAELMADVFGRFADDTPSVPDTGSVRGDVLALLRGLAAKLAGPAGQALRGGLGVAASCGRRADRIGELLVDSGREAMQEIVRRAGERGEPTRHPFTDRQLESGSSLILFHFLGSAGAVDDDVIVQTVDDVVLPLLLGQSCR